MSQAITACVAADHSTTASGARILTTGGNLGFRLRLLTNLFMEKQYVKLHNNDQATVFAISNRGEGGAAP